MTDPIRGVRVLVLNWRDIDHPEAGGAEVYAWELAKRFAHAGARVTYFTARHTGSAARDSRSGVAVVRGGGRFGVYPAAAWHLLRHRGRYDAVLDCQNGIPFFAPAFARRSTAVVCVIHHVHQEQFGEHFPAPLARIGRLLEKDVARAVYGSRPLIAVSPSTRRDVRIRLRMRGPIHIVPNGTDPLEPGDVARSPTPAIAVVSRLVPQKRLDLLLKAVPRLLRRWPDLRVDIAGSGPERQRLESLVVGLGLGRTVRLHGWVDTTTKRDLLQAAWLTVMPSVAEGWGLTVVEANSLGTPAVAFDVPGLTDSVRHGVTGWLLPEGSDLGEGVAQALLELEVPGTAEQYARRCRSWAASFSWEHSAGRAARVLTAELALVAGPREQTRSLSDLGVLVQGTVRGPLDRTGGVPPDGLRRTDTAWVSDGAWRAILDGCDEEDARAAVERTGSTATSVRLVDASDLSLRLPGGAEVGGPDGA